MLKMEKGHAEGLQFLIKGWGFGTGMCIVLFLSVTPCFSGSASLTLDENNVKSTSSELLAFIIIWLS